MKGRAPAACLFTACNRVEGGGAHNSAKAERLVRAKRHAAHVTTHRKAQSNDRGANAQEDDQGGHGSSLFSCGALGACRPRHEQVGMCNPDMSGDAPREPVLDSLNSKAEPLGDLRRASERLNECPVLSERGVFHAHIKHRVYGNVNTMFYTFCL